LHSRIFNRALLALSVGVMLVLAPIALAVDGDPDTGFGTLGNGKVLTPVGPGANSDFAMAVAVQDDGKIVVVGGADVGSGNDDFAVARYNPNGTLDTSFDGPGVTPGNGVFTFTFTPTNTEDDVAHAVAIQDDGKIVIVGKRGESGGNSSWGIARLNGSDGSFDSGFDTDGRREVAWPTGPNEAHAVAIQDDGKIVVAGPADADAGIASVKLDFGLARLNVNDGSFDVTFDGQGAGNGLFLTPFGANDGNDRAESIALQDDGKIVVAGSASDGAVGTTSKDFALGRYNGADGLLDTGFDTDGKLTTPVGAQEDSAEAVVIQPGDDKIVAGGFGDVDATATTNYDFALTRYSATDGSLDTGFDGPSTTGNGKFTVPISAGGADQAHGAVLQPDGNIVLAGTAAGMFGGAFGLARFSGVDGTLDSEFDGSTGPGDGKIITSFGLTGSAGNSLAIQTDMKLIVAGQADTASTGNDFGLIRYLGDGIAPDTSLTGTPPTPSRDKTPTFSFSSTDLTTGFQCKIDGAAFATCSSPHTPTVSDGQHTFTVRARDPAGNVDAAPPTFAFRVDTTAPDSRITKAPRKRSTRRRAKLKFTSTDAAATFECKLDRKPFAPCTSPFVKRMKRRKHTFKVRATDALGNVETSPATVRWRVLRP
jgi:uncharacterized delta-60 repeat protein